MDVASPRHWYRLHRTTWCVVVVLAAAIGYCQVMKVSEDDFAPYFPTIRLIDGTYTDDFYFGWPFAFYLQSETRPTYWPPGLTPPNPEIEGQWYVVALMLDGFATAMLLGATAFVFESWQRRRKRTQFTLSGLAKFIAVIAVLLTLVVNSLEVARLLRHIELVPAALVAFRVVPRPIAAVLLAGGACTIYATAWAACRLVGFVIHKLRPADSRVSQPPFLASHTLP